MFDSKLLLVVSLLASRGEVASLKQLLAELAPFFTTCSKQDTGNDEDLNSIPTDHTQTSLTLFNIISSIIILTPETVPPIELCFLQDYLNSIKQITTSNDEFFDLEEVFDNYKLKDPSINELVDCGPSVISKRLSSLLKYLASQGDQLNWDSSIKSDITSFLFEHQDLNVIMLKFVQARVKKVSSLIDDVLFNQALLSMMSGYEEFDAWERGLVRPLVYYNTKMNIFNPLPSLTEFEKMSVNDCFQLLIRPLNSNNAPDLSNFVILPFLKYFNDYTPLFKWFVGQDLNLDQNKLEDLYLLFNKLMKTFIKSDIPTQPLEELISIYLSTCYLCPIASLNIFIYMKETLAHLNQLKLKKGHELSKEDLDMKMVEVNSIDFFAKLPICEANSTSVKTLIRLIESCEKLYSNKLSIKQLLFLGTADKSSQLHEAEKLLDSNKGETKSIYWEGLMNTAYWVYDKTDFFSNIDRDEFDSIVLQKLLDSQLFEIILNERSKHIILPNDKFELIVYEKFKFYFDKATNTNNKIGSLLSATQCLALVSASKTSKINRAKHLLNAIKSIKHFKIFFEPGVPLTPHMIVSKDDPILIIGRILELNPKSYLAYEKLSKIMADLVIGLDKEVLFDSEPRLFDTLRAMCIESALIDNNFEYSYKNSSELLDTKSSAKFWLTFFQVGKFFSPEWDQSPLDVLEKQSVILAKTMAICPINDTKIILSQWNVINSEISRRDVYDNFNQGKDIKSGRSLESRFARAITSTATEVLNPDTANQAGQQLSNLLVSGLGWAIGATQNK